MKRIDDLPVRNKLYLVFGAIAIFILSFVAISAYTVTRLDATLVADSVYLSFQERLGKLKLNLVSARRETLSFLLGLSLDGHGGDYLTGLQSYSAEVDEDLKALLGESPDDRSEGMVMEIAGIWGEIKRVREEEVLPAALSGRRREAIRLALETQLDRYDEAARSIDALAGYERVKAVETLGGIRDAFKKTVTLYVLATVIGLGVSLSVILYISRGLGRRIASLAESIDRFDSGGKEPHIEVSGDDEIGRLAKCLRRLFTGIYESGIVHEQYMNIFKWESAQHQKKSEDLKKSEERFRGLVETTNDWVWEVDRDCRYTYASPKVKDILGYEPEDVIGKTPFDFMSPDEAGRVRALCASISASRMPFNNLENANLRKDGSVVVIETSGTPFFSPQGEVLGYRGIDRDITARKNAEDEKTRIQAQLVHADKMASVGAFAAGVAHEINNPVGFVNSNLNILGSYVGNFMDLFKRYFSMSQALEAGNTEEALAHLKSLTEYQREVDIAFVLNDIVALTEESKDGLARIKGIVQGLRDFSHAGGEDMSEADLNDCVESAVRLCWHEIKNTAELEKDFGVMPPVSCRPRQLTQVFLNMLVNASQAMPSKGKIRIRSYLEPGMAVVEIKDNGTGMPESLVNRIFEPFFTTKPVGKGTGLGLSIAYGIINEHKGRITVESAVGSGTTFRVSLPLHSGALHSN